MDRTTPSEPRKRPIVTWTVLALLGLALVAPAASADTGDCLADPLSCSLDDVVPGQLEAPEVLPEVPEVELPEVPELPALEVPTVELPELEVPEVPEVEVEAPEVDTEEPAVQGPGVGIKGSDGKNAGTHVGLERDALPLYPTSLATDKGGTSEPAAGPGTKNKVKQKLELRPVPAQFRATARPSAPQVPSRGSEASVTVPEISAPTGFRPPTPADVLRFAAATAERFAFPLGLTLAVLFFLAIERRIDRRDPKLATAPIVSEYESFE